MKNDKNHVSHIFPHHLFLPIKQQEYLTTAASHWLSNDVISLYEFSSTSITGNNTVTIIEAIKYLHQNLCNFWLRRKKIRNVFAFISGAYQPSNELSLRFYSYYKQATEGPCQKPKPAFWEVVKKAKWDAWNRLGNMSRNEAMENYVEELKKVIPYSL